MFTLHNLKKDEEVHAMYIDVSLDKVHLGLRYVIEPNSIQYQI